MGQLSPVSTRPGTLQSTTDVPPTPVSVPDVVSVAISEIAADVREGLLAIAVGAGLQVMAAMMAADVDALCGPRGKHAPDRTATRHGSEAGSVTLGGRRVPVRRPRVRAADGSGELPIASYEAFSGTEALGRKAMEQMLAGLSTRRYAVGLEPVGEQVAAESGSTSKSAISRRFVKATEHALADLMSADLSGLDLVAFMSMGCTSPTTCAWSPSGSRSTGSRCRWPSRRARPRTPPWSPP